ncbi:hypothetical protein ACLFLT_21730 [Klebsiella pneumoniae]
MLELSLLRHPRFVGVLLLPVATCCCYVVLLIIVPLHFMGGEGMSQSQSALYLMALTTPMLVFPSIAALLTLVFTGAGVHGGTDDGLRRVVVAGRCFSQ